MKKKIFYLSLILLFHFSAQAQFSNIYDFEQINTRSFSISASGGNEAKFHASSINICNELAQFAASGPWNGSKLIGNIPGNIKTKVTKLSYTPFDVQVGGQNFKLRLMFVRPDDNVNRPCVLLSPGNGADFENWYNYLALGVADYVSRGYAVAFYENYNNRYVLQALGTNPNNTPSNNLSIAGDPELPFYVLYQFGRAAAKYVVQHKTQLCVNSGQFFAGGNSAGGFSAYALALASDNNFSNPVFQGPGGRDSKVYADCLPASFQIKGIGILGSGLFQPNAKMGDLIDPTDANLCAVLWHGKADNQILPDCCPNTPCNTSTPLSICGGVAVGKRLCNVGIKTQVYVNCFGGHIPIAGLLNSAEIGNPWPSNPSLPFLLKVSKEMQQFMDVQTSIASQFRKKILGTPANICTFSSKKPKEYPLGANWHLSNSPSCINAILANDAREEDMPTEIADEGLSLTISPNPSTGHFRIQANLGAEEALELSVWNNMGQLVMTQPLSGQTLDISLDLQEQAAGIYWIRIKSSGKNWISKMVLVERG